MRLSSWLAQILPYVEQRPLWDRVDAYRLSPSSKNNPPHFGMSTVIRLFVCPADGRGFNMQFAPRGKIYVALTSYLGVEGQDLNSKCAS